MDLQDLSPVLPETIAVVFQWRRCTGVPSDVRPVEPVYISEVDLADITFTDPDVSPQPLGVPGSIHTVRDTAVALFTVGVADPTNKTTLDTLAYQIAQDFYDWRANSFDITYNGIAAVEPSGTVDLIEFCYHQEDCYTRIQSQPWGGEPEEFQHLDPAAANCDDSHNSSKPTDKIPYFEVFGKPESCTGGGATATCTVVMGQVTAVAVTAGGTYTGVPTVAFSQHPGDGRGATATATVAGGAVTVVTITNGGSGYDDAHPPLVSFNGGGSKLQRTVWWLGLEDGRLATYFSHYFTPS
jgi:hypothetical protein